MAVNVFKRVRQFTRTTAFVLYASITGLGLPMAMLGGVAHALTITQCQGVAAPSGYVVVAESTTAACGGASYNTYTYNVLTNGMSMCSAASRVPTGWVVTAIGNTSTCGAILAYGNQYIITSALTNGMSICSQPTRVPTGWVVTSLGNSAYCGNNMSNGNQYALNLPADNLVMCAVSSIPAGYHWVSWTNSYYCGTFVGGGSGNAEVIHS